MDELKLILETIQSMGGDAKEFGIWWLVCRTIPDVLTFIGFMAFLFVASRLLTGLIRCVFVSYQIAREVGVEVEGMWTYLDTRDVLQAIRDLKKNCK